MSYQKFIDMGLLSPTSRSDAAWMALANLGGQLINRGAPRLTPTPPPIDINSVMKTYQNAIQNDLQRGLALRQFQRSEEEYARKQQARDAFLKELQPQTVQTMDEDMAPMTVQQPSALMQSLPAAMRPIFRGLVLGDKGAEAFGAVLGAGLKDRTPTSIKTLNYIDSALARLPEGSPQRATLEAMKTKLLTPAGTNVSVSTGKSAGDLILKGLDESREAGGIAASTLSEMNELESLYNKGVKTGFGQELFTTINRALRAAGLSDVDVSNEEQFLAITTQAAISNVKKLGQNPTDRDLDMIFQAGPQLMNTREGNLKLIAAAKEKARRVIARTKFLNQFALENEELINTNPTRFYLMQGNALLDFDKRQGFGNFKFTPPAGTSTGSSVPSIFK
ncbi:MAG: hypothetical protein VW443_07960 [Pseudomonadales bacterium]